MNEGVRENCYNGDMPTSAEYKDIFLRLNTAVPGSHKGQNGKLLIIGGSSLFHAASAWSLQVAARLVDMVFYSSVPENNAALLEAKRFFWDGLVVPRGEILSYMEEADCVLIGPGMTRSESKPVSQSKQYWLDRSKESVEWDSDTWSITNWLMARYPEKRWVLDAGALQMAEPALLTHSMIVTPHRGEFVQVFGKEWSEDEVRAQSRAHNNCLIVSKGVVDVVCQGENCLTVSGGNPGMIKGGTGDVLAGLIAGLYCINDQLDAAVAGSVVCKAAGDELSMTMGSFFTTSELAEQIPKTLHRILKDVRA